MTCPECGATQDDEARFCSRCGTALLARPDEEPLSPAGDDEPMPALDDTADLDELLPFRADPDVNRRGGHPEPGDVAPSRRAGPPDPDPDPRRGCLGMVALAMVGLLMVAGLLWYVGSGDDPDSTSAAPTASSTTAPSGDPSPSEEASPSTPPTGPEPTERASTAKKCAEAEGATAWSGNEVTTCDFAVETARVLLAAGAQLPATITATSPVTKRDYRMECTNTTPVVCRGGTDALVYVDLPQ